MVAKIDERATCEAAVSDGVFTIREASVFSKLSRSSLYKEMDAGRLGYVRIGRSRRIPRKCLIALLAGGMVTQ